MGKRSTDGVTVNKVMVIITGSVISLSIGMATFIYSSDRAEYKEDRAEFKQFMKSMSQSIIELVINEKIAHARVVDMDARAVIQEKKLDKLYTESKVYWRRQKEIYRPGQ